MPRPRSRDGLSQFEMMLLLAVVRLGDDAYGVTVSHEIEAATGKEAALGSVYAALERLTERGLVSSRLGDPTPERGGRAKRYFKITAVGLREVRNAHRSLVRLWKDLPEVAS